MVKIAGIHHVTVIGSDSKASIEFYANVLNLRILCKTINFDEPNILQYYFGSRVGPPAPMISLLIHSDSLPGFQGTGQVAAVVFSVPIGSLSQWRERLVSHGVNVTGRAWAFSSEYLCFTDPDGMQFSLVEGDDGYAGSSSEDGIEIFKINSVEIQVEGFMYTANTLVDILGFSLFKKEGPISRFSSDVSRHSVSIDVYSTPNHRRGRCGPGVAHSFALSVPNPKTHERMAAELSRSGHDVTPLLDRQYFSAIYFRGRCGVRMALADNKPGFPLPDENASPLETLCLPTWLEPRRALIEQRLSQPSMSGRSIGSRGLSRGAEC